MISSCVYKDPKFLDETIKSIEKCTFVANFKDVFLFHTFSEEQVKEYVDLYPNIIFKRTTDINNKKQYAIWLMKEQAEEFSEYPETDFVLIVQNDSWIVNPTSWTDEFLKYDYIGALFPILKKEICGNGGFSLRSLKFMRRVAKMSEFMTDKQKQWADDWYFCRGEARKQLESEGFKFGTSEICKKFSVEGRPITNQFGHHCAYNIKVIEKNNRIFYVYYNKVFSTNPLRLYKTDKYLYLYKES
jgi:hypothetical protein